MFCPKYANVFFLLKSVDEYYIVFPDLVVWKRFACMNSSSSDNFQNWVCRHCTAMEERLPGGTLRHAEH